jgi:hypothetical protein
MLNLIDILKAVDYSSNGLERAAAALSALRTTIRPLTLARDLLAPLRLAPTVAASAQILT